MAANRTELRRSAGWGTALRRYAVDVEKIVVMYGSLIQRIRQFLDGEFSSGDFHDRYTGNFAKSPTEILIVGPHDVDSMFRNLFLMR
jgi:hypothetical protein